MKVANTRKVNERIVQYMSREQLNSLLGMGLSAPVSVDEIIFEDGKTGEGTPLLIAKAVDGSFAAVYTIYMSHEIEVDAIHLNDDPMTDAEIDAIVKFLTDVQFTPVEK